MVDYSYRQMKEEEGRWIAAVDAFHVAKKSNKELESKLTEAEREKRSAEVALDNVERQAKGQRVLLCQAEDQLATSKEQITTLKKKLEEAENARDKAEQDGYDIWVTETEEALRAEVLGVYRNYCLQVWNKALNQAGVEASSILKRAESVYYPLAIRASSSISSKADTPPEVADPEKNNHDKVFPSSDSLSKVAEQSGVTRKEAEITKGVTPKVTKPPTAPQDPIKDNEASRMEIVLATLPLPAKGDPKGTD